MNYKKWEPEDLSSARSTKQEERMEYRRPNELRDYGDEPLVINIDRLAKINSNFRVSLWTGEHLQVTLMSIPVGSEIGLEMHPHLDQFLRIEAGRGLVKLGSCKDRLHDQQYVDSQYAIIIPAGTWHNVINTCNTPLKLYSIYAPVQHPFGTLQQTKEDAEH